MRDDFIELIVKRKPVKNAKEIRGFLVIAILGNVLAGLKVHWLFFSIASILGGVLYYVVQNFEIEFEYLHGNNELVIEKVILNSWRKHMMTIDLNQIVIIAKIGSAELKEYRGLKERDFSAREPMAIPYVMIYKEKEQLKKLLLQLDSCMIQSLKERLREKVVV